jgi:phytoene dehydrogenase-like protein
VQVELRYHLRSVAKRVVIVGGGMAGLAAAIYLARAGCSVTIFERRRILGGRAVTHLRHGYRFNLGPHAVYRAGASATVYRELGIPVRGGSPPGKGIAIHHGSRYTLPAGPLSVLTSSLLSAKARIEASKLLIRIRFLDPKRFADQTVRQWLDGNISDERLRETIEAFFRLATYSDAVDEQSAAAALAQLKTAARGVVYVDEGWQKLVDALHSHAVTSGVNFITSSHVVRIDHDGAVRGIELGEMELDLRNDTLSVALPQMPAEGEKGTRIPADTVLLAVDPATAAGLTGDGVIANDYEPVTATCLDVALSRLPSERNLFALGIDRPHYFSVHSKYAQLTPKGGALIHVAKYRKQRAAINDDEIEIDARKGRGSVSAEEEELEMLLDELQPGWRDALVHRRFLPSMTVSNALVTPSTKRHAVRTSVKGLYVAGDWVGDTGMLSDAALSSAREAARAILAD